MKKLKERQLAICQCYQLLLVPHPCMPTTLQHVFWFSQHWLSAVCRAGLWREVPTIILFAKETVGLAQGGMHRKIDTIRDTPTLTLAGMKSSPCVIKTWRRMRMHHLEALVLTCQAR